MEIIWRGGVIINTESRVILADMSGKKPEHYTFAFMSHGHSDHIFSSPVPTVVSKLTYQVARFNNKRIKKPIFVRRFDKLTIDSIKIRTLSAGHVPGALSLVIESKRDGLIGYTGDLLIDNNIIWPRADKMDVDILIIEATYGHYKTKFPPRRKIYKQILNWAERMLKKYDRVFFYAYPLGKPQELTKIFYKEYKVPISVNEKIALYNRIVEKYGIHLGKYEVSEEGPIVLKSISDIKKSVVKAGKSAVHAILSGRLELFKKMMALYNVYGFPMSSHSDPYSLIDYIDEIDPREIFTIIEPGSIYLAKRLRKLKFRAAPLRKGQRMLDV